MPRFFLVWFLLGASVSHAQDPAPSRGGWELGARYWYSYGFTQWSHNAHGVDPVENGNPTSILTYDDLNAHAVEIHARKDLGDGWFIRGNAGLGSIHNGSLDDEDFDGRQVKVLDSTSSVRGNRLLYMTVDFGRELWDLGWARVGLFTGYHGWSERVDAYGAVFTVGGRPSLGETVPAISNEVAWDSLRLGASFNSTVNPKTRLSLDLAWVPYARLYNEDSHWQRPDLGPTPNVFMDGRGRGFQMDLELRYLFAADWEAGAGFRHWWIQAKRGDVRIAGSVVPLVEFETQRTGVTFSVTRRW